MNTPHNSVEKLSSVLNRMGCAATEVGRLPQDVQLIAVTKTFEPPDILPVLEAGHRVFGENRVQEAKAKWPSLRERYPDIGLHLIGPLQSNKVRDAVALFDVIHTVDRPKIAAALASEMQRTGQHPRLFVQVNTGKEPQKAGVVSAETVAFVKRCQEEFGLTIDGLMCIPPFDMAPEPHFEALAQLASEAGLSQLSMGMSGDYETAIRYGATSVRVGSAIFGTRA
jgi:pyridoxal phosphate enzyme (YggS family)